MIMKVFNDHTNIAKDMLLAINGIEAEIDATLSLNYRALQTIGINRTNGWCAELHSSESEELWNKQLKITPSDTDTMHHLAILHHARAFDMENGKNPDKSDIEWVKSEKFWDRLLKSDEFWDRLIDNTEGITLSHKKRLKGECTNKILEIHFAIAYSPEISLKRAKFHINHVINGKSNQHIIDEIRKNVYEKYISNFPDEIWIDSNTSISVLTDACTKIKRILDIDPECFPALMDIIRIQYRILESLAQKRYENQDNKNLLKSIYSEINDVANEWQAYFDLCILNKNKLSYDLIENIITWYKFVGDNKGNINEWKGAINCFESIALLEPENDSDKKYALEQIPVYHALYAQDLVDKNSESGKTECNKAAAREHHTPQSYYFLAQAYQAIVYKEPRKTLSLLEKDNALKMCEKGLYLIDLETNKNNILWRDHYIKLKHDIILQKAFEGTLDCIEHGEYEVAIKYINDSINKSVEHVYLYLYRCKCFIETNKINEAKLDFKTAEKLVQTQEDKDALENIRLQIEGLDLNGKYIKPAFDALERKQFNTAIKILTDAINEGYNDCIIYMLRCQCYVGSDDIDKAKADLIIAEKTAKTDGDKKDIQDIKKYLLIDPPTLTKINQLANEMITQLKEGLPYNIKLNETNCLKRIKELIKSESKKWSRNSINIVAELFVKEFQNNFDYYCYRNH